MKNPHVELGERYARASGIYRILNRVNGKSYIGSAVNLRGRLSAHMRALARNDHCNQKLQRAYLKYGADVFELQVLLLCDTSDLVLYEQMCIDAYRVVDTGYNISPTAGSCLGVKPSVERNAKISAAKTGKKVPLLSIALKGNQNCLGVKRSAESIEKTVGPQRGIKKGPASLEARMAQSAAQRGKKHSQERRLRASERMNGVKYGPMSDHGRHLRSRALIGKPWSAARRAAHKQQTEESRIKRIAGQARRRERERSLSV